MIRAGFHLASQNPAGRARRSAIGRRVLAAGLIAALASPVAGQTANSQDEILRLSEILGAIHHLREICGNNERQLWRDQMVELLEIEQPETALRTRMTEAFNRGYNDYRRTYGTCTPSAKTATARFFEEGGNISKLLASRLQKALDKAAKIPVDSQPEAANPSEKQGG